MLSNSLRFISDNVKGIQSFEKRIEIFEYLKKATSCGFIFLHETHCTIHDEKKWNDVFKGKLFLSHGQSNSCGVAIGFIGNTGFEVSIKKKDESGRIPILDVKVSDNDLFLIYLYHANKKSEQLNTLSTLCNLLDNITDLNCNSIILGGGFNIFFNLTYKARSGNLKMKYKSEAKFIHIKESLGLSDFGRVINPKKKRYAFRQQHVFGFIQRRLDYLLVSNNLQESINKTDILTALTIDHSPILFSFSKNMGISRGKALWKFNNSWCHKTDFITELKNHLKVFYNRMSAEQITDEQLC